MPRAKVRADSMAMRRRTRDNTRKEKNPREIREKRKKKKGVIDMLQFSTTREKL